MNQAPPKTRAGAAQRQPQRRNPYEEKKGKGGTAKWVGRLLLFFVALTLCAAASLLLFWRYQQAQAGGRITIEGGDPNLGLVERAYLQTYLATRAGRLEEPAGSGSQPLTFIVDTGESANQIAANLQAAGLLNDPTLFLNYVQYYGLDAQLEAGSYELDPQMTVPDMAAQLTHAVAQEIVVRFLEGWRSEEMANYLATTRPAAVDSQAFLAIVQREAPFDLQPYSFLASHPAEASLEGFLFPDTYHLPLDADATYLVDLMLKNFGERVNPTMRQLIGAQGLSLREAVTLASIVEREGVLNGERPTIASVFYNRLTLGMKLDADPTVQYAVGYDAVNNSWWKSPLFQTDLDMDSPYNTYLYEGLPPGPIANPGLSSLQAVAEPAQTQYIFFVADCSGDNPGAHNFSETYEQHLVYVQACQ
ncbi:MAG: endolytic transglycosylase MltG [Ardenticatenales bacterium]|nr:endolytic transglycosylase MltG [Ardenticatenales bacterium]